METGTEEVTLEELLELAHQHNIVDLHTAIPARVESYNASKQTVDVVPQLNRSRPDGQGNYVTEPLPKLSDVPVAFPRCKTFALTFPLAAGDYVLLVICERNIGAWRATGNQGDPGDIGMHTLDGAVAIPGLYPDSSAAQSADPNNMVLGNDTNGAAQIVIKTSEILAGSSATNFVAMADKVLSELNSIATALVTHTHSGVTTGPGITGTSSSTYLASAVASSNLKAID